LQAIKVAQEATFTAGGLAHFDGLANSATVALALFLF